MNNKSNLNYTDINKIMCKKHLDNSTDLERHFKLELVSSALTLFLLKKVSYYNIFQIESGLKEQKKRR